MRACVVFSVSDAQGVQVAPAAGLGCVGGGSGSGGRVAAGAFRSTIHFFEELYVSHYFSAGGCGSWFET
jgi:hypothetical protein